MGVRDTDPCAVRKYSMELQLTLHQQIFNHKLKIHMFIWIIYFKIYLNDKVIQYHWTKNLKQKITQLVGSPFSTGEYVCQFQEQQKVGEVLLTFMGCYTIKTLTVGMQSSPWVESLVKSQCIKLSMKQTSTKSEGLKSYTICSLS